MDCPYYITVGMKQLPRLLLILPFGIISEK